MIEPTETEVEGDVGCLRRRFDPDRGEARADPVLLKSAPHNAPVKRLERSPRGERADPLRRPIVYVIGADSSDQVAARQSTDCRAAA